ncbi:hypothetical protein PCAR4_260094 [Paraburkholderia caribensis]|nr:hypothetical protein PCAR4_260094 [Paraburkholderia caribensis]
MKDKLLNAMPAILAASRVGRVLATGDVAVSSSAIRDAAKQVGFFDEFSGHELSAAMKEIGAVRAASSATVRYRFPNMTRLSDVVAHAAERVALVTRCRETRNGR